MLVRPSVRSCLLIFAEQGVLQGKVTRSVHTCTLSLLMIVYQGLSWWGCGHCGWCSPGVLWHHPSQDLLPGHTVGAPAEAHHGVHHGPIGGLHHELLQQEDGGQTSEDWVVSGSKRNEFSYAKSRIITSQSYLKCHLLEKDIYILFKLIDNHIYVNFIPHFGVCCCCGGFRGSISQARLSLPQLSQPVGFHMIEPKS